MRWNSNNAIAVFAGFILLFSLVLNSYAFIKANQATGAAAVSTARVQICVNAPPAINHSCGGTAYVGFLYTCDADAVQDIDQNTTFSDSTHLFDIDPATGLINFTPKLINLGNYSINITATDNSSCSNNINLTILALNITRKDTVTGLVISRSGLHGVVLNWSVPEADSFNVYYSSDVDSLRNLNFSDVTNISGITDSYWNDPTAPDAQRRFYRVGAVGGGKENMSREVVGKFDIYFVVNDDGSLGRKLFSIPFNRTYYADPFLAEMCDYSGTITRLDRSNPNYENYEAHSCASGSYNNFSIDIGDAFYIYLNISYNYTVVGPIVDENLTVRLIANSDGRIGRNLFGTHFPVQKLYANPFLTNQLCSYSAAITKLSRDNVNLEDYQSHSCNSGTYNNFSIEAGDGYFLYVNASYNYTIR